MSTATPVPETWELTGDDARRVAALDRSPAPVARRVHPPPRRRRVQPRAFARVLRLARAGAGDHRVRRPRHRARQDRHERDDRPVAARRGARAGRRLPHLRGAPSAGGGCDAPVRRARVRARRFPHHGHDAHGPVRTRAQPHLRHRAGPPDAAEVRPGVRARDHDRGAGRVRLRLARVRQGDR